MSLKDIYTLLEQTGYPVAYHHFITDDKNPPPKPPYILYLIPNKKSYGPDNYKALIRNSHLQIELYTVKKDTAAEETLESIFDSANFSYESSEDFIDSEKLYQVVYEIDIVKKL